MSAGRSRNAHCLQANIHTAPQVIRLAGRFFKAALRRTKDAASKAFVQREARGQGLRLRHITLLPLTSPKLRQPLPAGSAGLPQLVQKPRRVSPQQRRKKVKSFSQATCAAKKILLRLQVWNLCAVGAQIMRAADCSPFVKKEYFLTATTPQAIACGVASAWPRFIASEAGLAPSGSPAAPAHNLAAADVPETATTPQAEACGVASLDAASAAVSISSLGRRRAAPSSDHSDSSAFFSADSFLIFGMPQMNAGSTTTISA